jgi:N-acetylglutamate synthase-like GNAT family acetyltransferase
MINYYPTNNNLISIDSILSIIESNVICLESIDVYPKNKIKCGYGSKLLKHIISHCKTLKYKFLVLNVLNNENYLINWYQKNGFVKIDELINNRHFSMKLEL